MFTKHEDSRCAQPDSAGEVRTIDPTTNADAHQSLSATLSAILITFPFLMFRFTMFRTTVMTLLGAATIVAKKSTNQSGIGFNTAAARSYPVPTAGTGRTV